MNLVSFVIVSKNFINLKIFKLPFKLPPVNNLYFVCFRRNSQISESPANDKFIQGLSNFIPSFIPLNYSINALYTRRREFDVISREFANREFSDINSSLQIMIIVPSRVKIMSNHTRLNDKFFLILKYKR